MSRAAQQIEELLASLEMYRQSPEESGFTDASHLLTYVETVLEDCMVELLNLPITEHRSLLDRVIRSFRLLSTVGESVENIINIF